MRHLFFLCGAGGGSSLLKHIFAQCENVVSFEKEGDKVWEPNFGPSRILESRKIPEYLGVEFLSDDKHYQWGHIHHRWNKLWDKKDDDRIYMQKSVADFGRWQLLIKHFQNVHFVVMPRNPFAHIEGMRRKCNYDLPVERFAEGWLNIARAQQECISEYSSSLLIKYEDLCLRDADYLEDEFQELTKGIEDINLNNVKFQHPHNRRLFKSPPYHGIAFNVGSINRLSFDDIYRIKKVLKNEKKLVEWMGY